jgi:hypothetical protein
MDFNIQPYMDAYNAALASINQGKIKKKTTRHPYLQKSFHIS